ncbi:MAG: ABC transporter ATP-binding protein [Rhodobacteraceae bacterium]|nr:ABC transporter ATP-binding protein [Paracoccaceae bacterium]
MLEVDAIHAAYGQVKVLFGLSITVRPGEIHCLLGRNGAGKTTTVKSIMGLVPLLSGTVTMDGEHLSELEPYEIPGRRVGLIPQGRRLFAELTVEENLEIGLLVRNTGDAAKERVLDMFPRLRERLQQPAATLSGGEQQMLAVARALCIEPKVLLLDEPTEGLQPSMIELIRSALKRLRDEGVAILLVEQRIDAVLSVADRVSFIENGRNVETLPAEEAVRDRGKLAKYLGV